VVYYAYDAADRLLEENWKQGASSVYAFAWDYDAVSNRVYERRDLGAGATETYFQYDAANALAHAHALPAHTHAYYAYDKRGNCVQIQAPAGTQYFQYDDRDLVTAIRYRDGTTQYFHHDARMRMYAMEDGGETTYYTWDENGLNLLTERDAQGNVTAEYTHGHSPVDGAGTTVAARKQVGGCTYYQYPGENGHHDTVTISNAAGVVTHRYTCNAWGELVHEQVTEPAAPNSLIWQANWLYLKEGVYKPPGRLYLAELGRYLQRDPLGAGDGGNLYTYGRNRPSVHCDASGLYSVGMDWLLSKIGEKIWIEKSHRSGPTEACLDKVTDTLPKEMKRGQAAYLFDKVVEALLEAGRDVLESMFPVLAGVFTAKDVVEAYVEHGTWEAVWKVVKAFADEKLPGFKEATGTADELEEWDEYRVQQAEATLLSRTGKSSEEIERQLRTSAALVAPFLRSRLKDEHWTYPKSGTSAKVGPCEIQISVLFLKSRGLWSMTYSRICDCDQFPKDERRDEFKRISFETTGTYPLFGPNRGHLTLGERDWRNQLQGCEGVKCCE